MPNGNVIEYIKFNPEANRLRLVIRIAYFPWDFLLTPLHNP